MITGANYTLSISKECIINLNFSIMIYNVLDIYATTGNLEGFKKLIEDLEEKRLDEINKIIKQMIEW